MTAWNKVLYTDTQKAVAAPVWYATRTICAKIEDNIVEGKLNLAGKNTSFKKGDTIVFIPLNADYTVGENTMSNIVEVLDVDNQDNYTLSEIPVNSGKVLIVKSTKQDLSEPMDQWATVPVTITDIMEDREGDNLLPTFGITTPGWYRWRVITEVAREDDLAHGAVPQNLRYHAELLVGIKAFEDENSPVENPIVVGDDETITNPDGSTTTDNPVTEFGANDSPDGTETDASIGNLG